MVTYHIKRSERYQTHLNVFEYCNNSNIAMRSIDGTVAVVYKPQSKVLKGEDTRNREDVRKKSYRVYCYVL